MSKLILVELPNEGLWNKGYPIHTGNNENSINKATIIAKEKGIIANQKRLKKEHDKFVNLLKEIGFELEFIQFPKELKENNHDGIFIRDSGFLFNEF